MIEKLQNKIVLFDFDGVLCTYQAGENKCHIPEEEYIRNHVGYNKEPFKYSRAPKTMQDIVKQLDPNKTFILSAVETVFEYWSKLEFTKEFYPSIKEDHVLFVARSSTKLPFMQAFYDEYFKDKLDKQDIVLIEDTLSTIYEVEDAGFRCYHISSFLV